MPVAFENGGPLLVKFGSHPAEWLILGDRRIWVVSEVDKAQYGLTGLPAKPFPTNHQLTLLPVIGANPPAGASMTAKSAWLPLLATVRHDDGTSRAVRVHKDGRLEEVL